MAVLANCLLLLDGCVLLYFAYGLGWVAGIRHDDTLSAAHVAAIPRLRWLYRTAMWGAILTLLVLLVHVLVHSVALAGPAASVAALGFAAGVAAFLVWLTFSKARRL